jgi:hypothetical protein
VRCERCWQDTCACRKTQVWYLAHPVRGDVEANLRNVKEWLRFLFRYDPDNVYIAPWVAEVEAMREVGEDTSAATLDKALKDDCEVVRRCDGILLVGGRITDGMRIELNAAREADIQVLDLSKYVTPRDIENGVIE